MKNKAIFLVVTLFLIQISGFSQQKKSSITFDSKMYQFGTVKEESADVNIRFDFTNTGSNDLVIQNLNADKGIEIVDWTKDAVSPGEKGFIKASFHPKGHPGRVNKRINVYTDNEARAVVLSVYGNVTPIPGTIADQYRKNFGDSGLRLKNTYVTIGNISNKDKAEKTIDIINTGAEDMTLTFKYVPAYMTVKVSPEALKPNEKGVILVSYDASKNLGDDGSQNWGAQNSRFYVIINGDNKDNRNSILVKATIIEDFSHFSKEAMANAPHIKFEEMDYHFDTITQGDVVKHDFVFTNTGVNDLEIRYVKAG